MSACTARTTGYDLPELATRDAATVLGNFLIYGSPPSGSYAPTAFWAYDAPIISGAYTGVLGAPSITGSYAGAGQDPVPVVYRRARHRITPAVSDATAVALALLDEDAEGSLKVASEAVERSGMSAAGKSKAQDLLRLCARGGVSELVACPTDDDGLSVEIVRNVTGRDLLFAIPEHGKPLYFTARIIKGHRNSGVVLTDSAVAKLIDWVEGRTDSLPVSELKIG